MKTIAAVQPMAPKKGYNMLAFVLMRSYCRVANAEGVGYYDARFEKVEVITDRVDRAADDDILAQVL